MVRLIHMAETVAEGPSTVLLTGESGTGKERIARLIHERSRRAERPFVALNCGSIPSGLMESNLFGHKKGAFTGANANERGFMRAADTGTLFLDEISEMDPAMQVRSAAGGRRAYRDARRRNRGHPGRRKDHSGHETGPGAGDA